jgi:hypothetical protein
MKILPVAAELLHSDGRTDGRTHGQTDTKKLIVAFCNFGSGSDKKPAKEFYLFVVLNCLKKGIYLTLSESVQGFECYVTLLLVEPATKSST